MREKNKRSYTTIYMLTWAGNKVIRKVEAMKPFSQCFHRDVGNCYYVYLRSFCVSLTFFRY